MTDNNNNNLPANIIDQLQLVWNLFRDPEVPWHLKLLPIGVIVYLISPVDFVPELIAGPLGLIDDPLAILIGLRAFINLSPQHVVARLTNPELANVVEGKFEAAEPNDEVGEQIVLNPDQD